jgi:quercetin dioxygenase-like cupin family protein
MSHHPDVLPSATPENLSGLVDYATAAVVSRSLAGGPAGNLTLFAFDAGQGLSEHSAPYDAWVLGVDGDATLTIGGQPVRIRTGELVLMPAGVPHALSAERCFKMLLVMLKNTR